MRSSRDVDEFIREALGPGEGELWDDLGEPSLVELVSETFAGRRRFLNLLSWVLTLVFFLAGLYSAVHMLEAQDTRQTVVWLGATGFCCFAVFALKTWGWLEMVRISVTREVKRVELQLAHLAKRIDGAAGADDE
ncbi:MAG: hypothetical protein HKO77_04305 [Gemmatimonadetes bacterium]|nr:hypothetical protein [Gemmatimonadota bacterium]NNM31769.1 hypothetical protein [Gemmatimonadota bacterium]